MFNSALGIKRKLAKNVYKLFLKRLKLDLFLSMLTEDRTPILDINNKNYKR